MCTPGKREGAASRRDHLFYSELMPQSWPAKRTLIIGPDPWPRLPGGWESPPFASWGCLGRNCPLPRTLSQIPTRAHARSELPHAGKWHMETWPRWLGNLLGTCQESPRQELGSPGPLAQGPPSKAGCCRGAQVTSHHGLGPRLRVSYRPHQVLAAPQHLPHKPRRRAQPVDRAHSLFLLPIFF